MPIPLAYLITDLDLGGTPLLLRTLATGLRDAGTFAPTVISLAPPGPVADLLTQDHIPVYSLNVRCPKDLPLALSRWVRLLKTLRPAIVHSHLIHANLLAMLGRPFYPNAVYFQGLHTLQTRPRWHWFLQGFLSHFSPTIVPHAHILCTINHFGPSPPFASPVRGHVIPNGIDVPRFQNATPPTTLPWPADAQVIGYIGRFDPVKRLPILLDAFAILSRNQLSGTNLGTRPLDPWRGGTPRPLHLALIGYGPQETALREQAQALGIADRVHFPGATSAPEKWHKSLSVFCLPSDAEGFGMAVAEALAAGVAVVACDTPPVRDLVGPHARLVPAELSPELLAVALQGVIKNPPTENQRMAAATHVQTHFSHPLMLQRHQEIYQFFSGISR